ncbi:nuclear transport factor 2 family protein [Aliiglaciecola sp. M165]|uniref:nuclear transport factor 2 family protein n=1 Tax=Aliiglaciecola sp. M165 TaxID=2593649 RepID=UPI00117D70A2|nr:nuclear transport factor 2 family protein [Aliiglaciecola sp. M165]TRY29288.1 nuclear transport factor 2 family protein [Aliiglaciecola sp. M165]
MKKTSKLTIFRTILALLLVSHGSMAAGNTDMVEQFVDAFNKKDIATMLDSSAEDLRWMRVSGPQFAIETSSHEELRQALQSYFESTPSAKSKIRFTNASGNFVYALEEASWVANGIKKSQCSMAVYELENKKIQNVWYFQEHAC